MNEDLKLSRQICFPLYTISKEIIRRYTPFLEPLDLTYPQYLTMMVLWEFGEQTVGEICEKLHLDTGTITPLLKRLYNKGFLEKTRCKHDERTVKIILTEQGLNLQEKAKDIPKNMANCLNLNPEEIEFLKKIMEKLAVNSKC